jgi:predicted nuclease of predicted toxin-antitoxin system
MKFLANENFPLATTKYLEGVGDDIRAIGVDSPSISDFEVMAIAIEEDRTILTFDRDYGELIFRYNYRPKAGIIYLRFKQYSPNFPGEYIHQLIGQDRIQFQGTFTVLDEGILRQRNYL